jgi:Fe2+ transport system protein FeoA
MISLTKASKGIPYKIKEIKGEFDTSSFFANIGAFQGETIKVISSIGDNYVVQIKNSRFGIDKRFARIIMVDAV